MIEAAASTGGEEKKMDHVVENVDPDAVPSPYPGRTEKLPWSLEALDAGWLTRLIQNKYPQAVAETLEQVQLFNSHSTKLRIAVGWNEAGKAAGLPRDLCIKTNWSGAFNDVDICALEARFYHFLAEKMTCPTARCYYADWDSDGKGQGLVLLEDLTARGGKFGHTSDRAGITGLQTAFEGLAKLHGGLWDSPLITKQAAPWLQTSMETAVDHDQVRIMWEWIEKNLTDPEFCAIAPKHYVNEPRRVERAYDKLVEFERGFKAPYCVLLGDCHQGNTYLQPDGQRLWLDWQLARRGRPWRDVTYFMIGALSVDERRHHQRDILAFYRDRLIATGAQNVIGLDEIWEQYRRWVMYGIQAWVANSSKWGQESLPMNERFFTAAEDLGTWKLLLDE
jgi:hypothetical protein